MFSKTYLKQPAGANQESRRLRNRLGAFVHEVADLRGTVNEFAELVQIETGAVVPNFGAGYLIEEFFHKAEFRDVLDAVSCMTAALRVTSDAPRVKKWIAFCKRAFEEEG